jgi:hypothetical protein
MASSRLARHLRARNIHAFDSFPGVPERRTGTGGLAGVSPSPGDPAVRVHPRRRRRLILSRRFCNAGPRLGWPPRAFLSAPERGGMSGRGGLNIQKNIPIIVLDNMFIIARLLL